MECDYESNFYRFVLILFYFIFFLFIYFFFPSFIRED